MQRTVSYEPDRSSIPKLKRSPPTISAVFSECFQLFVGIDVHMPYWPIGAVRIKGRPDSLLGANSNACRCGRVAAGHWLDSNAYAGEFTMSRRWYFWIFPLGVIGN